MSKTDKQTSKLTDVSEATVDSSKSVNLEEKVEEKTPVQKKAKATSSKKEIAKKETSKKESTTKKTTKKTVAKVEKTEKVLIPQVVFQFQGNELDANVIVQQAKEAWIAEGNDESSIESLAIYIKPEEVAAYYVINDKPAGKIQL